MCAGSVCSVPRWTRFEIYEWMARCAGAYKLEAIQAFTSGTVFFVRSIRAQGFYMLKEVKMRKRFGFVVILCGGLALFPTGKHTHAQEFDVPTGFVVAEIPKAQPSNGLRELLTVRPEMGPFAELSSIRLHELTTSIEDPDDWLRGRVSLYETDSRTAEEFLESPDSPFDDPAFDVVRKALPELFESLNRLGELPLEFCDGPTIGYNAEGQFRELYCVFEVGPLRQYNVMRLQEVSGNWFFTEIHTMNERRLRHLLGIANSFTFSTNL